MAPDLLIVNPVRIQASNMGSCNCVLEERLVCLFLEWSKDDDKKSRWHCIARSKRQESAKRLLLFAFSNMVIESFVHVCSEQTSTVMAYIDFVDLYAYLNFHVRVRDNHKQVIYLCSWSL